MLHLVELNVSHNQIESLDTLPAAHNLKVVDASFNHLLRMGDLSAHHYLQKLCLDSEPAPRARPIFRD